MNRWVEITFDCLPLRSVVRLDVPLDASPAFQAFCERVKAAIDKHGQFNSFYLYNGRCTYHLTNREDLGMIQFRFEGTMLTDEEDRHTVGCDLDVSLLRETCRWLSEPIVEWLRENGVAVGERRVRPVHRSGRSGTDPPAHRKTASRRRPNRRLHRDVSVGFSGDRAGL